MSTEEEREQFLKKHGHTMEQDRFYMSSNVPKTEMNCKTCKFADKTKVVSGIYCEYFKDDTRFLPITLDLWNCDKYIKV